MFFKRILNTSVLIMIFTSPFFTCKQKENLKNIMTGACGWDVIYPDEDTVKRHYFKFKENGECYYFVYEFIHGKKTDSVLLYSSNDVILTKIWSLSGDTIATIMGHRVPISRFTKDSIFFSVGTSNEAILVRNCNTKMDPKYK